MTKASSILPSNTAPVYRAPLPVLARPPGPGRAIDTPQPSGPASSRVPHPRVRSGPESLGVQVGAAEAAGLEHPGRVWVEAMTATQQAHGGLSASKAPPWDQRPGENDLWFARFLRYVALGQDRSVSLVAKGRKNAYPVPAHWPIQSKQNEWKARALAFDRAALSDTALVGIFNAKLASLAATIGNGEADLLKAAVAAGGYHGPPDDEDDSESGL